jgi:hypothetical protein
VADRWEVVTVTAGAGATASGNIAFSLPVGEVVEVKVVVPAGHANKTEIALYYAVNQIIPKKPGAVIKGNDRTYSFDVANYPVGAGWTFIATNNGTVSHSWHLHFGIDEIEAAVPELALPLVLFPLAG